MEITTFNCRHCGASIDIPDIPGAVACAYCGSRHRVSFHDGEVSAELIAKVRRLDEDVARLKGTGKGPTRVLGLNERLEKIEEGKRKWHEYVSSVNAGESKDSPEMAAIYKGALAYLLVGYGPGNGELVNDYYNPKSLDDDPVAGRSCFFILIGLIVLLVVFGAVEVFDEQVKQGIILLSVALVGIVAGIPFVINMIRADKADIAKRKEAIKRLTEIESDMRRRTDGVKHT